MDMTLSSIGDVTSQVHILLLTVIRTCNDSGIICIMLTANIQEVTAGTFKLHACGSGHRSVSDITSPVNMLLLNVTWSCILAVKLLASC